MTYQPNYPYEELASHLYWQYQSEEAEFLAFQEACAYEHQKTMEEFLNQGENTGEEYEMYLVTAHH